MRPIANSQLVDVICLITQQLNCSHTQFVCPWIGHVHSMFVTKKKGATITVITY